MKTTNVSIVTAILCACLCASRAEAQVYNTALTMQNVDRTTTSSAASSALGGIALTVKNDVGLMFANPASLQSLDGIRISVGAYQQYRSSDQTQMWYPSANYPNFSLLMAGLTDTLTLPVIDSATYALYASNPANNPSGADTIFRQFDNLQPNWQHSKNSTLPLQAFVGLPFTFNEMKCAVGIGVVEYANLNYFYQNNNVLTPDPGMLYPRPFLRPLTDDNASVIPIVWSQSQRMREGAIAGYGGALSCAITPDLSLGVSGMFLKGSTDDAEVSVGRGILAMHRTFFSLGQYAYYSGQTGTSDFTGQEFTVSGSFENKYITVGLAAKPPSTIKREYAGALTSQNPGQQTTTAAVSASDELRLPWRGSVGLGVAFHRNMSLKLEYEYLPFSTALYTATGTSSNPWLDNYKFKAGFEFVPESWLVLRCGYAKLTEAFATQNYYFPSDPLPAETFSGGIGVRYQGIQADLAYVYAKVSYEDMWTTNANLNTDLRQSIVITVSYVLQ